MWDVQNNSTTVRFTFEVVKGLKPELIDLYAQPAEEIRRLCDAVKASAAAIRREDAGSNGQ